MVSTFVRSLRRSDVLTRTSPVKFSRENSLYLTCHLCNGQVRDWIYGTVRSSVSRDMDRDSASLCETLPLPYLCVCWMDTCAAMTPRTFALLN